MKKYKIIIFLPIFILLIISYSYGQISFETHIIEGNLDLLSSTTIADIDNDGHKDIVGTEWNRNELLMWKNSGSGTISWDKKTISDTLGMASFVVHTDIDNDNDIDLVASGWDENSINIYYNDGSKPVNWVKKTIDSSFEWPHEVRTADIDNDGFEDIIGAATSVHDVAWWKNPGTIGSGEWIKTIVEKNCMAVRTIYPGDIDNDGRIDLVTSSFNAGTITWYKNNADMTWSKYEIERGFLGPHMVHMADFNADGYLDIACAGYNPNSNQDMACWLNDGVNQTTWTKIIIDGQFNGALGIISADIDLDNDMDIIGTAGPTNKVAVWLNNNNGLDWEKIIIDNFMEGAWGISSDDIDLDGDIDICIGGDKSLVWYENTSQLGLSIENEIHQKKIFINSYPNPFNPTVNISYNIEMDSFVSIIIYDLLGNKIRTLKSNDTKMIAGNHYSIWNGKSDNNQPVSSGTYVVNIMSEGRSSSQKICLIR